MSINIIEKDDAIIIVADCLSLSKDEALNFKNITVQKITQGNKHIQVDLSKTEYIDSSGIGKLLFLNKKLLKEDGSFKIVKISKKLYVFLESLAITKVIDIAEP